MSSRVEVTEPIRHPLDEALSGEEIDALKIKDEDLRMVTRSTVHKSNEHMSPLLTASST